MRHSARPPNFFPFCLCNATPRHRKPSHHHLHHHQLRSVGHAASVGGVGGVGGFRLEASHRFVSFLLPFPVDFEFFRERFPTVDREYSGRRRRNRKKETLSGKPTKRVFFFSLCCGGGGRKYIRRSHLLVFLRLWAPTAGVAATATMVLPGSMAPNGLG